MPQFAISDIHGCARTFDALLNEIQLSPSDELFLLGDYIDRGPDSKGVIDRIWALQSEGYQVKCLKGNHEEMLLESLDPHYGMIHLWRNNGGQSTLRSFGLTDEAHPMSLPKPYLDFMAGLDYHFQVGPYFLVHAGLNFEAPDPLQDQYAMLWIRHYYENIDYEWLDGRILVHGHTPRPAEEVEQQLLDLAENQILDIDAGCVFNKHGRDSLCAFNLTDLTLTFVKNQEEVL